MSRLKRTGPASCGPGRSRNQKQPYPDEDGSDSPREAFTSRREALDGDGCCHESHRAQIHHTDGKQHCCEAGTAVAAVQAETQAESQGRTGVRRQRKATSRCLSAAAKVMSLE